MRENRAKWQAAEWRSGRPPMERDYLELHPQVIRPPCSQWLVALAATITLVAVNSRAYAESTSLHYRTPVGGMTRVPLSDASVVELNTATDLTVRLTPSEREVRLLKGEAQFTVAQEPRPLDVRVGTCSIRAMGTTVFDVRRLAGKKVTVIVTSGRVAIMPAAKSGEMPVDVIPSIATLAAGEAAEFGPNAITVRALGPAAEQAVAWTHGWLWFEEVTLSEAIAEFNRYHRRQVVIGDPDLGELKIGGSFESADLEGFINALRQFGIDVDNSDPAVLRLSKTR